MSSIKGYLDQRSLFSIHIGGVFVSAEPAVVRTVLGSCIAVCMRDPVCHVGGMNHFMLPCIASEEGISARYGVHAMEILINECMKHGAERSRLQAKVFGGGHVLKVKKYDNNVPQMNIRFVTEFLKTENIPLLSQDMGGYVAREVFFFTDSGRILLKRLETFSLTGEELRSLEREEQMGKNPELLDDKIDTDSRATLF